MQTIHDPNYPQAWEQVLPLTDAELGALITHYAEIVDQRIPLDIPSTYLDTSILIRLVRTAQVSRGVVNPAVPPEQLRLVLKPGLHGPPRSY